MTIDQLATLYHQASACAESLCLPLRNQVWRGMAGEFQGAGTGSSTDFQDHRAYAPGDDPRHINWQAYARTGNYTMKMYREEVRPVIDIILDASDSMFFTPEKAARTAELFYFTIISAIQASAATQIHVLKGEQYSPLPLEAITSHRWYESVKNISSKSETTSLALDKIQFRSNAIRIMISDLLFEGDPSFPMKLLTAQQGKAILFTPYLQTEAQPEWSGNYEFTDAEKAGDHPHRIEERTLNRYKKAYSSHFGQWHSAAKRFSAPMARVSADKPLLEAFNEEAVKSGALIIQ